MLQFRFSELQSTPSLESVAAIPVSELKSSSFHKLKNRPKLGDFTPLDPLTNAISCPVHLNSHPYLHDNGRDKRTSNHSTNAPVSDFYAGRRAVADYLTTVASGVSPFRMILGCFSTVYDKRAQM
jgi:hypothetical protein